MSASNDCNRKIERNMRIKFGVFFGVIGYLIFFFHGEAWAEWENFVTTDEYSGFYDIKNVTHPSEDVVRFWTRTIYTQRGTIDMVQRHGQKFENLDHDVTLWEIDCADRMFRFLSGIYYSKNDEVLSSDTQKDRWRFITTGSTIGILYKELCRSQGFEPPTR